MANILIIDSDSMMTTALSQRIGRMKHYVLTAHTLEEGLNIARDEKCDLVVIEARLPDGSGVGSIRPLRHAPTAPEIILYTGSGDSEVARQAIKNGAWDYIEKGFSTQQLLDSVASALQYREEKQSCKSVSDLKDHSIIGESESIRVCLDLVAQAASTDANVLITGETGAGKELFAEAIHRNSHRAGNKLVVIDCTTLPETLIESLLFGHEKGAFTGADRPQEGLFKQADGGTLFLDEVGELPLSHQKAFLRILQEKRFRAVGSRKEESSDFRLIAATNRNLDMMAQAGEFRKDLLFRLRSFLIIVPPLRERLQDIRPIVEHHVNRLCEGYGIPAKKFSHDFFDTLMEYHWPGNVRELIGAIETALTTAREDPVLYPRHLPTELRIHLAQSGATPQTDVSKSEVAPEAASSFQRGSGPDMSFFENDGEFMPLKKFLDGCERDYLQALLDQTEGNISECSRISGLSRARLYVHLRELGLHSSTRSEE
ncbi:MAG: sigma-54-dependent transcriptional regulator [Candidatus Sumerlaeia bacterium]